MPDLHRYLLSMARQCGIFPGLLFYYSLLMENISHKGNLFPKPSESVEAYIQTVVLKKTLESISFERRRGTWQEEVTWDNPVRLSSEQGVASMPSDCPGQVIQV